ncbi:MAG TPA: aldehyde ferredoxin oxidoreductase family protein [Thermoleophilia bacterium]|nr:aldehyde ferredoxin oxidoreductase family protein [Thermoleophilia bacterium]
MTGEQSIGGFWGKVLLVDVGTGETREEPLDPRAAVDFVGGRGLGAYYLFKLLRPGTDALAPENPLIFTQGPLSGTAAPGSARAAVVTKSPLTGLYLFCITGGELGPALCRCGYDVIVLTGRAQEPVYVEVGGGAAKIRSAAHLWGLDTQATQEYIREELSSGKLAISCIGPGGERRVPYACLINERRALGRGGAGAVMGAKNVKALVVREGPEAAPVADPVAFKQAVKKAGTELRENPFTSGPLKLHGSMSTVAVTLNTGIMPAENWRRSATPLEAGGLMGDALRSRYLVKDAPCGDPCPARCTKVTVVRDGPYAGATSEGPEFETAYALGTSCGIYDLGVVIAADQLCDLLGLDTISVGVTIAFAMECFERGLLTTADTDGIDLRFGNAEAMLRLVRDAAYRRGFGARIALGSRALAEEIGRGSEAFAMHCKGMEVGGYDPRGAKGMALVYGCGPRGGCHHAGGYTVTVELTNPDVDRFADSGKAPIALGTRNRRASAADSACTCAFLTIGMQDDTLAQLVAAATGRSVAPADLYLAGERINALERILNVREGLTPADDAIPRRLIEESVPEGMLAGQTVDWELMRGEFYAASGLDPATSLPTPETLARLGLEWVRDDPAVAALMAGAAS